MKKKAFILTILSCMLCIALVVGGVYAATYLKLSLKGQIDFIDYNKLAYIEKIQLANCVETTNNGASYDSNTVTLVDAKGSYLNQENSSKSIDISNYKVIQGETLEIQVYLINLTTNYLKVNLLYSTLPSNVVVRSSSLFMEPNYSTTIQNNKSSCYKICITNKNSGAVSLSTLNFQVTFEPMTSLIQTHASGYHYVEMGTIPGEAGTEYIKWRYISSNGTTQYSSQSAPSINGYYILETDVSQNTSIRYDSKPLATLALNTETRSYGGMLGYGDGSITNIEGKSPSESDYFYSNVRKYINGEKVYHAGIKDTTDIDNDGRSDLKVTTDTTSYYSDMYTDFLIDTETDLVYNMITGRYMSNLYYTISKTGGELEDDAKYASGLGENLSFAEKFWLASAYEITQLLCGGTWDSTKAGWNGIANAEGTIEYTEYWLRTPACVVYNTAPDLNDDYAIMGFALTGAVKSHNEYTARPCFMIR